MAGPEDTVNVQSIRARYDLKNCLERITTFAKKYPVLSVIIGTVVAIYAVPVAIYMAFSVGTFVLTFVGFLIILGGILLTEFLVLSSVLAMITIIFFFVCAITCFMYATYRKLDNSITDALIAFEEAARRDRVNVELQILHK